MNATTYPNSTYAAATKLQRDLPGIQTLTIRRVLRESGIELKRSVLATDLIGGVVQFFVDLLVENQTRLYRDIDNLLNARYDYESDATRLKIIDNYVTMVLDSIHEWFKANEKIDETSRLEEFLQEVYGMTTKLLTERMIQELSFSSSIRHEQVEKARAYALILDAMRKDYTYEVNIIEPGRLDRASSRYDIVRDDITPGLTPVVDEEEVQAHYLKMKSIIEKETPFVGQVFTSKRGGHTVCILEKGETMVLRKQWNDGTVETVTMPYSKFTKYMQ